MTQVDGVPCPAESEEEERVVGNQESLVHL